MKDNDDEKPSIWRRAPAIGLYMGLVLGLFEIIPMVSEGGVGFWGLAAVFGHRLAVGFVIGAAPLWYYGVTQGALVSLVLDVPFALVTGAPWYYWLPLALLGGGLTGYMVGRFRTGGEIEKPGGHR